MRRGETVVTRGILGIGGLRNRGVESCEKCEEYWELMVGIHLWNVGITWVSVHVSVLVVCFWVYHWKA